MAKKRLLLRDKNGNPIIYDVGAGSITLDGENGKDLPTKLAEMETQIEAAGQGDGTVTGVKVGSTTYPPNGEGVVDISPAIPDTSGLATKSEVNAGLDAKVDKNGTDSLMTAAEHAKLQNLPTADQLTQQLGQKANDNAVVKSVSVNGQTPQTPTNGNVNISVQAGGETVVINSDGANIVDSHTNPSILVAPSARQMYMAYNNIATLFRKVNDLYDKLAGIAFTDGKPASWKEYADWSTPAIPEHTITLGTMTNVSVYDEDDNIVTSPFDTTEGEVTLKLTPAQGTMILTENISIKLGTKDVPFTTSADNDSTLVTFVLAGDVTITASASSGIGVQVNGNNVSANVNGIALTGDNRTIILSHPNHFEWDGGIGLSVNSVALVENTDYTLVSNQDGTKTITVLKTFTSDAYPIVITASVVEDDHAILDLTNVGSGVTVNKANNAHVYVGDTISILPASGNKVSASATVGGSSATLTGDTYAGYTYTIGSGDVSSGGTTIAITATATALNQSCQITLPSTGNGIASVALTDLAGTAITSPVVEGTGIKIVLTPDTDYTISTISIANMTEGTDYNVTDNNGVKTITIQHVTGNVAVSATAWQPSILTVNTKWADAYKVDNGVETPITSPVELTDGQPLTIVIKSPQVESSGNMVDRFVIAADGYGELYSFRKADGTNGEITTNGTIVETETPTPIHNQTDDVTAEVIVSDNNAVVTFDKTSNTCTIYIAAVNGSVSISAKGRLRIDANTSPGYGHTNTDVTRKLVSISVLSAVSFNEPLWWYHYGHSCGVAGTYHELKPRRISDGAWRTWSTNAGQQNYRDIPNPYNNTDYYDKFVCSFPIMAIFDTNTFTGNNVPRVLIKSTNEVLVSVDDLRNAYYTKW